MRGPANGIWGKIWIQRIPLRVIQCVRWKKQYFSFWLKRRWTIHEHKISYNLLIVTTTVFWMFSNFKGKLLVNKLSYQWFQGKILCCSLLKQHPTWTIEKFCKTTKYYRKSDTHSKFPNKTKDIHKVFKFFFLFIRVRNNKT